MQEMISMRKNVSAMGIVLNKDGAGGYNVLILENDGEWVFPKGHVEEGEDFVGAAIREIQEETGVSVTREQHRAHVETFSFFFDGENAQKIIEVQSFMLEQTPTVTINREEGFTDGKFAQAALALEMLSHDDARNALRKALAAAEG
jgi:8-oxo-dGTP pyrophosphatase MutT (NUDIX family)